MSEKLGNKGHTAVCFHWEQFIDSCLNRRKKLEEWGYA